MRDDHSGYITEVRRLANGEAGYQLAESQEKNEFADNIHMKEVNAGIKR